MKLLAVIRIRGDINLRKEVSSTLKLLGLKKKHNCVVIPDSKINQGMVRKIKDYVTYGEIDKETLVSLLKSRSNAENPEKTAKELMEKGTPKIVFRLHPPRGGFKSIKKTFKSKGDLGYRGEEINKLLKRMM